MVSIRNRQLLLEACTDKRELHYGLRKLTVGVASVLLGTTFFLGSQAVHADTINSGESQPQAEQSMDSTVSTGQTSAVASQISPSVNQEGSQANSQVNSGANNEGSGFDTQSLLTNSAANMDHQVQVLAQNKLRMTLAAVNNNNNNGGFDVTTWGTLDVSKWTGSYENGYYKLTNYTGDKTHIIIPNEADFAKAGRRVGHVGIARELTHSWFLNGQSPTSIAFSKTDGKKVTALGQNFDSAFSGIIQWDDNLPGDTFALDKYNLTDFDGSNLDVSQVTSINHLFDHDRISDLSSLSSWNTSRMISMACVFSNDQGIHDLSPLKNWDVSRVTLFDHMFDLASLYYSGTDDQHGQITDLAPLANWNMSNATNLAYMFQGNLIKNLDALSNWDVRHVTDFSSLFTWNRINDISGISSWHMNNATNLNMMFYGNQISDISLLAHWDVSRVTDLGGLLGVNKIFDLSPLANWNVSHVTDFSLMLMQNLISNITPLANWNVSSAITLREMFKENKIVDLSPLASWNVGRVTDLSNTFAKNQISDLSPLTNWNVSLVTSFLSTFSQNKISDLLPLQHWLVNKATDMSYMFWNNQISDLHPIMTWQVSNVTDMNSMFQSNNIVNLDPIATWNTSAVQNMSNMFEDNLIEDATSIAHWNLSNCTTVSNMLAMNPLKLADFRYWPWPHITTYDHFITSDDPLGFIHADYSKSEPIIHLVTLVSNRDYAKLSTPVPDIIGNPVLPIKGTANKISVNGTSIDMPTIYATDDTTTDAETLAERLVKQTREQKLRDYASNHNIAFSALQLNTPDPTNHQYDVPEIMANQAYHSGSATVTYTYVDDNNHGMAIGSPVTFTGYLGTSQTPTWTIPRGYQLAKNQILPTTIILNVDGSYQIHLVHVLYPVDPDRPITPGQKTSTGKLINGAHDTDLIQTITRVINITEPGQATKTITQIAKIFRDAKVDDATGEVTYGVWSTDAADWNAVTVPEHEGYTVHQSDGQTGIPMVTVKDGQKSITIDVTYTADNQSIVANFIDQDGQMVATKLINGKVGQIVDVANLLPDGWVIYSGQRVPTKVTFGTHNNNCDFLVSHLMVFVASNDNVAKGDLIKGTQTKTYPAGVSAMDLNKAVTRTINVTMPSGAKKTVTQSVHFMRNAVVDAVTGEVNYFGWSENGSHLFADYVPSPIDGYKTDGVKSLVVTPDSQDSTVDITYVPVAKTITVNYKTADGKLVSTVTDVKADKDGNIQLIAPAGYVLSTNVDKVKLADSKDNVYDVMVRTDSHVVTFDDVNLPAAVSKDNLKKTVSRTIMIVMPNGRKRTIKQTVTFVRTANVDSKGVLLGYNEWQATGRVQFNSVFIPKRAGYTLRITDTSSNQSLNKIAKVAVTPDMANDTITVSYAKN